MKAIVHARYGAPEVLRLVEVETPKPENLIPITKRFYNSQKSKGA